MAKIFKITIVTKEKLIYEGDVESLIAPGFNGYLGVEAYHVAMVCILKKGILSFRNSSGENRYNIDAGVLEVQHNQATLLVDMSVNA